jgi:CHASE2 domain-containing sensor protein
MAAVLAGQYDEKRTPFLIDFSIRTAAIPKVSFADVLRGDPATLQKLQGKKVIVGGTALELGDRFSTPNGGVVSGPVLQALEPAEAHPALDLGYRQPLCSAS